MFSIGKCVLYFYKIITDEILKNNNKAGMVINNILIFFTFNNRVRYLKTYTMKHLDFGK
jgi:hypothetical protein